MNIGRYADVIHVTRYWWGSLESRDGKRWPLALHMLQEVNSLSARDVRTGTACCRTGGSEAVKESLGVIGSWFHVNGILSNCGWPLSSFKKTSPIAFVCAKAGGDMHLRVGFSTGPSAYFEMQLWTSPGASLLPLWQVLLRVIGSWPWKCQVPWALEPKEWFWISMWSA